MTVSEVWHESFKDESITVYNLGRGDISHPHGILFTVNVPCTMRTHPMDGSAVPLPSLNSRLSKYRFDGILFRCVGWMVRI